MPEEAVATTRLIDTELFIDFNNNDDDNNYEEDDEDNVDAACRAPI